jgi:hypothetical protein
MARKWSNRNLPGALHYVTGIRRQREQAPFPNLVTVDGIGHDLLEHLQNDKDKCNRDHLQ